MNKKIFFKWDNHKLKIDLNNILFFNSTITCALLIKENENILLFDPEYGFTIRCHKKFKRNVVF